MDNKELDEILQKYAESTRSDKEVAFKKLREKPQEVKRVSKRFKPQYAFALSLCIIVVALSIALPITLTSNPTTTEPVFCDGISLEYSTEESISVFIDDYHMNAYFPAYEAKSLMSISSKNDGNLHGALIGYNIFEDVGLLFVNMAIVPKTHILETYESYFSLTDTQHWAQYVIKCERAYNANIGMYEMQIYFTDGKYDYFVAVNSYEKIETTKVLDILYD